MSIKIAQKYAFKIKFLVKQHFFLYSEGLPALKDIPKIKLLERTFNVDKVLGKLKTHIITKTNELIDEVAAVLANMLGARRNKKPYGNEAAWRRRSEKKIKKPGDLRQETKDNEKQLER